MKDNFCSSWLPRILDFFSYFLKSYFISSNFYLNKLNYSISLVFSAYLYLKSSSSDYWFFIFLWYSSTSLFFSVSYLSWVAILLYKSFILLSRSYKILWSISSFYIYTCSVFCCIILCLISSSNCEFLFLS